MRPLLLLALVTIPAPARGQGPFRAEVLEEGPPAALSAAIRSELLGRGYRVVDARGIPFADIWLRRAVVASGRVGGHAGRVQFPSLADGTLLGAVRYSGEGQDFRDQTIEPGVYTLRYGVQPGNATHARQSPFRDFALLLPAAEDPSPADLARKPLEAKSAEAAGSSHPAVLTLLAARQAGPAIVQDAQRGTSGLVVPLTLAVKGDPAPACLHVQIIITGAVPAH